MRIKAKKSQVKFIQLKTSEKKGNIFLAGCAIKKLIVFIKKNDKSMFLNVISVSINV